MSLLDEFKQERRAWEAMAQEAGKLRNNVHQLEGDTTDLLLQATTNNKEDSDG